LPQPAAKPNAITKENKANKQGLIQRGMAKP
jgi:hypothetical protein